MVDKAMRLAPEERYQSVAELQHDIRQYLVGRTLTAADYTPLQRAGKFVSRHRVPVAAAALLALTVTGLTVHFRLAARRAQAEQVRLAAAEGRQALDGVVPYDILARGRTPAADGLLPQESPGQRSLREGAIEQYVQAVSGLDRALKLSAAGSEDRRALRAERIEVGRTLGRIALLGADYGLARQAFEALRQLEAPDAVTLIASVEQERRRVRPTAPAD